MLTFPSETDRIIDSLSLVDREQIGASLLPILKGGYAGLSEEVRNHFEAQLYSADQNINESARQWEAEFVKRYAIAPRDSESPKAVDIDTKLSRDFSRTIDSMLTEKGENLSFVDIDELTAIPQHLMMGNIVQIGSSTRHELLITLAEHVAAFKLTHAPASGKNNFDKVVEYSVASLLRMQNIGSDEGTVNSLIEKYSKQSPKP